MRRRMIQTFAVVVLTIGLAAFGSTAGFGEASHAGWPEISCEHYKECHHSRMQATGSGTMRGTAGMHNELLGGHGSDTIYAGDEGDIIWGDANPSGQPESQVDHLYGGAGNDWIYASHGTNYIWTGAGNDHVALVYGHGTVNCNGGGHKTLVMRYLPVNRHYNLLGCAGATIEKFRGPE